MKTLKSKHYLMPFGGHLQLQRTVGYGDIVPVTDLGRTVAMFYMFFGIAIGGMFISIIGTRYYKKRVEPKEDQELKYEEKILKRIDDLENDIKEIRDALKGKKS